MPDYYTQACISFTCCAFEAALLEEAFLAAHDWDGNGVTFNPSRRFAALFPPVRPAEPWSGLQGLFDDPDVPTFGAKIAIEEILETPRLRRVRIFSTRNFEVGAISKLIRACCGASLLVRPIGFEYALSCDKPVDDAFGGGWCIIRSDRIEHGSTREALGAALAPDG